MAQQTPTPKFQNRAPTPEERDRVLGEFVDAWDTLDQHVQQVFSALLGAPYDISKLVLGLSRENNRFKQMLLILGKLRLGDKDFTTLDRLCARYDRMAAKRNRIIHGHWYCVLGQPAFRGDPNEIKRSYAGSNILDAAYFSAVTFTTVGFGDVLPKSELIKVASASEALLGVLLIGLSVAGFSNRSRY